MTTRIYPKLEKNSKLPPSDWNPKEGIFYKEFMHGLKNFDTKSKKILTNETFNILGKCIDPKSTDNSIKNTGSVIGYVQSGKTTSFNALAMLAIDNGFKLIIVLGGRTNNLLTQNRDEFEISLKPMLVQSKVKLPQSNIGSISQLKLDCLIDRGSNFFPVKPIVSVNLKHQGHILKLAKVLDANREILNQTNVLVIDDEADNASLNSMASSEVYNQSAVYAAIKKLRKTLKRHSFVQYTATPQALLLTSKSDELSPEWVRFITPGKDYVGTKDFFHNSYAPVTIPNEQLLGKNITDFELPNSLFKALFAYLITAAQATLEGSPVWPKNITIMIHPHGEVKVQDKWGITIDEYLKEWRYEIDTNKKNWVKTHKQDLKDAYKLLQKGVNQLNNKFYSFEELIELIPLIVKDAALSVLNSKSNPRLVKTVDWDDKYNIVIGGNLLDRGFVVKGLVTTYMPRKGSTNADTLQQRGRFYGYKRKHLGFLKLWLGEDTHKHFKAYLDSEEVLYDDLKNWTMANPYKPLQEWTRRMVLSPILQPCRKAIIGIGLVPKFLNKSGWFWPKEPLDFKSNEVVIKSLIDSYKDEFISYPDSESWTPATKSLIANNLKLEDVMKVLVDYDVSHIDSAQWAITQASLGILIRKNYSASIVLMGTEEKKLSSFHPRMRSYTESIIETTEYDDTTFNTFIKSVSIFRLKFLHQGKTVKNGYPGGEKVYQNSKKTITFQIHKIKVDHPEDKHSSFESLVLAIKMPSNTNMIAEISDDEQYDYSSAINNSYG